MEIIIDVFDPFIDHIEADDGVWCPCIHAAVKHNHRRIAIDFSHRHLPGERPPFVNAKVS